MIDARFVPMDRPAKLGNKKSMFKSTYAQSLEDLEHELKHLGATQITIQAGYPREKIRNDGWPFSSATPTHPACIVQFTDRKRRQLAFRGVQYAKFADNIRAIAKTLEALRAVDRYGVVEGEQYTGFKQLGEPPKSNTSSGAMSRQSAAAWIAARLGMEQAYIYNAQPAHVEDICGGLKRKFHPDVNGGKDEDFKTLMVALRSLREAAR